MKGHKPYFDTRGTESSFWVVTCECGWAPKAVFITRKREAKQYHDEHLLDVLGIEPEWVAREKLKESANGH